VKILADLHIAPSTVEFLRALGHDVVRVGEIMSAGAADRAIVEEAAIQQRVILTQDLDFSAIIALGRRSRPSILSLRLASSRIEHVNAVLQRVLPAVENNLMAGAVVSVEDARIRVRRLPVE
jgi:predicted nuclease of predicted toxin-antitoxin system